MGRAAISLGWPVHLLYQAPNVCGLYAGVWGCHEESVVNFDPVRGRGYPRRDAAASERLWLCQLRDQGGLPG